MSRAFGLMPVRVRHAQRNHAAIGAHGAPYGLAFAGRGWSL
jgi:hypothetical protein